MIFLTYDIKLPSKIKRREYETMGNHILHRMGTAFFRKYLSMMLPYVKGELGKIATGNGLDDNYSPELMQRSSEIILEIIQQYGFNIPDYMNVLTWDDDYADNSRYTYQDAMDTIRDLYDTERKQFWVDEKFVTISLDKNYGDKMCASWESSLPNELCSTIIPSQNVAKIRFNRAEFEKLFGLEFESGIKAFIKKYLK